MGVRLLCVLGLVALAAASDRIGNPMNTRAFVKTNAIQQASDEPEVGGTDMLTDDAVVEGKFSNTPVNLETLKEFIKHRGISDAGLIGDLIVRAACIVRLEVDTGSDLSPDSLTRYLDDRDQDVSGSRDSQFMRACDYQEKERIVRKKMGKPIGDVTEAQLTTELRKLGFLSTSQPRPQLVYNLGKAYLNIDEISRITGNNNFDTSELHDLLSSRGLSTEGSTGERLDRLASYLVDVSESSSPTGAHGQCDMILSSSVCVDGGGSVIAPSAAARGLVGHWTFDDALGQDTSGKQNHLREPHKGGPGVFGQGASAAFDGTTMAEIPHSEHFESSDFCVTMWLYLLGDSTGQWRSLLHKGVQDHERTPTRLFEPQTRGLEFFVSTSDTNQPAGERLWSNTFVPLRRWTHIGACAEGRNMRLFINGILDSENTTVGQIKLNQGSMYVGHDPWRPQGGVESYVDELHYFSRALSVDEMQAQVALGIGGVEPAFVELGCMGCTLDACTKSCRRGYHSCTHRNVVSGAYNVARSMGWANSETRIWTAEDSSASGDTPVSAGLCMCCRDDDEA